MRSFISIFWGFLGKDAVVLSSGAIIVAVAAIVLFTLFPKEGTAAILCYEIAGVIIVCCFLYVMASILAELGDDRLPYCLLLYAIFASAGFFAAPIGLGLIGTAILLAIGVCLAKSFREYEFSGLSLKKYLAPLFGEFLIIFIGIAVIIH
jgi:hypothetical protein